MTDRTVNIKLTHQITSEDLLYLIADNFTTEEIALFIANLDLAYENWELTELLIGHFKELEEVFEKENIGEKIETKSIFKHFAKDE